MDEDMKEDMKEENDEDYEYEPKVKGKSIKKSKSIKVENPLTKHCNECDMSFKSAYSLKAHKLEVHNDGKAFQCTVCPAKFSISGNLKSHMMIHTGEKNFACTLCEYKCNRNDSLKKHMATHVKDRVKPNKCPQCEKTFFKAFAMKKHISSVHEGVMPFACHVCAKRFKSKTGLDYHVTLKHDANGRTFDEKTDPEEYKDNPKLAEILRRKAASLKKTSCKLSDELVFRKQDHVKDAHTDPEGNIKCPKPGCDLKFPSYRLAYYHINGVHNKVPCTLCGEMIGTKHMYTHMQRKHGINPPVKKFNCEFCGKGFAYKLELHDHRNTHTGEKTYLCKFCGKGFASFGTQRMHEKGHLGFKRKK
jgi:KRAB domain-containing zinc finger protein